VNQSLRIERPAGVVPSILIRDIMITMTGLPLASVEMAIL